MGIFKAGNIRDCSKRLIGMTWGPEDLSSELGAEANRDADMAGSPSPIGSPARSAFTAPRRRKCRRSRRCTSTSATTRGCAATREDAERDGFTGRLAIHPAQVPVINEVFTPSEAEIVKAKAVVAAFAANPGAGAVGIDGKMYDRPHLARAQRAAGEPQVTIGVIIRGGG